VSGAAATVPASPYRGLGAFGAGDVDALFFFGRERDTATLTANLLAARFTVLFGPAGVGKSSILHAGVVRRTRTLAPESVIAVHDTWTGDAAADLWHAVAAAAGTDPKPHTHSLADRLEQLTAVVAGEVYLVLDQFEELFTYGDADTLVEELADVVSRPWLRTNVLVAVRDDALSELDAFTGRMTDVFANTFPLDRLDRAAGASAITGPLTSYNELSAEADIAIEPELVGAVLDEVAVGQLALGGLPPSLTDPSRTSRIEAPYLQLVMQRLWETERERGSQILRLETLNELGGAETIVRAQFDGAVESLEPTGRDIAAQIFNHLVTPSGAKVAHRVDDLAQYAGVGEDELHDVLRSLSAERILRPLDGHIEIYHDVLADAVLAWRTRHEGERALERQRAAAERRQRRTLLFLAAALVAVAAMAVVTVYALTERAHARDQTAAARAAAQRATARTLDAQAAALIPILAARRDPELGLLLAADAARLSPTLQAQDILRRALLTSFIRRVLPDRRVTAAAFDTAGDRLMVAAAAGRVDVYTGAGRTRTTTIRTGGPLRSAALSPDGRLLLTVRRHGRAAIWDVRSGRLLRTLAEAAPTAAVFSPDGALVATAQGGSVQAWRVGNGSLINAFRVTQPIDRVLFGPRGDIIVLAGGRRVRVFSVATGKPVATIDHGAAVTYVAVTPNERTLVTAGRDHVARAWSLGANARVLREFKGHTGELTSVAISPNGGLLLTTSTDGTGRVWNLATGTPVATLTGHINRVEGGAFSADGSSVLTWSDDGTAILWRSDSDYIKAILVGPNLPVTSGAFGTGDTILTTSADGRVRLWNAPVRPALRPVTGLAPPVAAAAFAGNGTIAVVADRRGISVVRARDGRHLALLDSGAHRAVAASRDGSLVAATGADGLDVWSLASRRRRLVLPTPATAVALGSTPTLAYGTRGGLIEVRPLNGQAPSTLHGPRERVTSLALGRRDHLLGVGYADGSVAVWNLATGKRLFLRRQHRNGTAVKGIAFDEPGRRLATTGADSQVFVIDAVHGTELAALRGHYAAVDGAAFSPNGRWLVTAGPGSAGLWDLSDAQRLLFLDGHHGPLLAATFDPTGRRIATVGSDATMRAYRCEACRDTKGLLQLARTRLDTTGRKLTPAEQRQYLASP
jgi:WD40 repeat protein